MTTEQLRRNIKKSVDSVPPDRLSSLAEYVAFLARPVLRERLARAERDFAARKGVNWRAVRRDV